MDLKDCYMKIGGNLDEVLGRLSIRLRESAKILLLPDYLKAAVW